MSQHVAVAPLSHDETLWRVTVPLAVLVRCERSQLITVWIGLRWLRAAFPRRRGFSTREIARAAHVNRKYIIGWLEELVELGLVERQGSETVTFAHKQRTVYGLPLAQIECESLAMLPQVLADWQITTPQPAAPDLTTTALASPEPTLTLPAPPRGEYALAVHPFDLWRVACPTHRAMDITQLQTLANEHDEPTDGYGMYWVGRAIMAASLNEDVRLVAKVRVILNRWRSEATYGSDVAPQPGRKEQRSEPPTLSTPQPRFTQSAAPNNQGTASPWKRIGG